MSHTSKPTNIDFLKNGLEDASYLIMGYLDDESVRRCSCVSRIWNRFSSDEQIWEALCRKKWSSKQNRDKLLPEPVKTCSNVDNDSKIDKNKHKKAPIQESKQKEFKENAKVWTWKERFRDAELDSRRDVISFDEICDLRWAFQFQPDVFRVMLQPLYPRFRRDYTYISRLHHEMKWRFIDETENSKHVRFVQVNSFPPLRVKRTSEWGWLMWNDFVEFMSVDPSLSDEQLTDPQSFHHLLLEEHEEEQEIAVNDDDNNYDEVEIEVEIEEGDGEEEMENEECYAGRHRFSRN